MRQQKIIEMQIRIKMIPSFPYDPSVDYVYKLTGFVPHRNRAAKDRGKNST